MNYAASHSSLRRPGLSGRWPVFALVLLALTVVLCMAGHIRIGQQIAQEHHTDLLASQIEGQSRMLDRLGQLAADLHAGDGDAVMPLRSAILAIERMHAALLQDRISTSTLSPALRDLYYGGTPTSLTGPAPLDRHIRDVLKAARRFLVAPDTEAGIAAYTIVQDTAFGLSQHLDQAAAAMQAETELRIEHLRQMQGIALAIMLLAPVLLLVLLPLALLAVPVFHRLRRQAPAAASRPAAPRRLAVPSARSS